MGLRFRRSKQIAPGIKFNVNKNSVGVTVGGKYGRITKNSSGRTTTSASLPGTGLYYQSTSGGRSTESTAAPAQPERVIASASDLLSVDRVERLPAGEFFGYQKAVTNLFERRKAEHEERTLLMSQREVDAFGEQFEAFDRRLKSLQKGNRADVAASRVAFWVLFVLMIASAGALFALIITRRATDLLAIGLLAACVVCGIVAASLANKVL